MSPPFPRRSNFFVIETIVILESTIFSDQDSALDMLGHRFERHPFVARIPFNILSRGLARAVHHNRGALGRTVPMPYYSRQVYQSRSNDPKRHRNRDERDPQNPSQKA